MPPEVSERRGELPKIIDPVSDELLCQFFFGQSTISNDDIEVEDENEDDQAAGDQNAMKSLKVCKAPSFGAN